MLGQVEYVKVTTKEEALSFMVKYGEQGRILAGGTDIIRQLKQAKNSNGSKLIDIKGIAACQGVAVIDNRLEIGPLTTINQLLDSAEVKKYAHSLWQGAKSMASPLVRNKATVGGNLANASPAADMAPPLIALGATFVIEGIEGMREIAAEDFFLGPGKNVLTANQLITKIKIPLNDTWQNCYLKHGLRNAQEIAIVSVAVSLAVENGVIQACRLALGAVGPTPVRAKKTEEFLIGSPATNSTLKEASMIALEEISPISDLRGSAAYRQKIAQVLTFRALEGAVAGN